jgi:hypothetical protein
MEKNVEIMIYFWWWPNWILWNWSHNPLLQQTKLMQNWVGQNTVELLKSKSCHCFLSPGLDFIRSHSKLPSNQSTNIPTFFSGLHFRGLFKYIMETSVTSTAYKTIIINEDACSTKQIESFGLRVTRETRTTRLT